MSFREISVSFYIGITLNVADSLISYTRETILFSMDVLKINNF